MIFNQKKSIRIIQLKRESMGQDKLKCIKCGSLKSVKNGFVSGHQRYKCMACGYQYTKQSPHGLPIFTRILSSSLCLFGVPKRKIAQIVGVTPTTIVRWIKKYHVYYMTAFAPLETRRILTVDEVKKMLDKAPEGKMMVISRDLPSGGRIDVLIHPGILPPNERQRKKAKRHTGNQCHKRKISLEK